MARISVVALAFSLAAVPAAHAQAAPDMLTPMRSGLEELAGFVQRIGETVPEAQLDYRPVATVRTIRQLLGHIADGNAYYCGRAGGVDTPWAETVANANLPRAQLLERVRASFAACAAAHTAANAARAPLLMANYGHVNLHYGNLVTYLRMIGLTPPSS